MKRDIVRIPVKAFAGSTVKAKVEGPAKHMVNSVTTSVKGKVPSGLGNQEVELRPNGTGKVVVTITLKPPQPNTKPKTMKYEFTVKGKEKRDE